VSTIAIGSNPEMRRLDRDMRLFEVVDIGVVEALEMDEGEDDLTVPAGVEAAVELELLKGEESL
jgi:hypothetical protein